MDNTEEFLSSKSNGSRRNRLLSITEYMAVSNDLMDGETEEHELMVKDVNHQ